MAFNELEYKGLNLLDQVGTVELAINAQLKVIHVYDTQQIVDPEYDFQTKNYRLSDGFFQMASVLMQKQFIDATKDGQCQTWVDTITWLFYGSRNCVKAYKNKEMSVVQVEQFSQSSEQQWMEQGYYSKYVYRILSE